MEAIFETWRTSFNKEEILSNVRSIHIDDIIKNYESYCKQPEKVSICIKVISTYLFKEKERAKEKISSLSEILPKIITKEAFSSNENEINSIFKVLFDYYQISCEYNRGLHFFNQFINYPSPATFTFAKGFSVFFAYVTKNFEGIEDLLTQYVYATNYTTQAENRNFCLFCFYKGLIYLYKKDFTLATFSFLSCCQNKMNRGLILFDFLQFEAIKHLIFLYVLVDNELQSKIRDLFDRFSCLSGAEGLEKYIALFNSLKVKTKRDNHAELDSFIAENNKILEKDKLLGLANIALRELKFSCIKNILKKFSKITAKKLSALSSINEPEVIQILKFYTLKGRIVVRYDGADGIIEVINAGNNDFRSIEELKQYYEYLNNFSKSFLAYDAKKIQDLKVFERMTEDERKIYQIKLQQSNLEEDEMQGDDEMEDMYYH